VDLEEAELVVREDLELVDREPDVLLECLEELPEVEGLDDPYVCQLEAGDGGP